MQKVLLLHIYIYYSSLQDYAGSVKKVIHLSTKEERGIKIIKKANYKDLAEIYSKYRILKSWVNRGITKY